MQIAVEAVWLLTDNEKFSTVRSCLMVFINLLQINKPVSQTTADKKKDDATLCLIYNAKVFQSLGLCNVKKMFRNLFVI